MIANAAKIHIAWLFSSGSFVHNAYFCTYVFSPLTLNISMTNEYVSQLAARATDLLCRLIAIPSASRDEEAAANYIERYMRENGARPRRHGHNVWCMQECVESNADTRPTLLLNAHIDTVRPTDGWTLPPFEPTFRNGRLYGLGSNDCGGGLVSLLTVFLALKDRTDLPYRLVFLASAEEEVSGKGGIESVLPLLPHIDVAMVGEPTGMRPAIAEKGLMVLDCTAHGKSGHAARNEGVNAIYRAMADMEWFRTFRFAQVSPLLGEVKMSVTMVQAGTQHNVVPDVCRFVVDVRSNECYTNLQILDVVRRHVTCDVVPRSTRLSSSGINASHPLVQAAVRFGGEPFGSPTLSDQALMPFPSFKMGPGDSARSHTADEYICLDEIVQAIGIYLQMLLPL